MNFLDRMMYEATETDSDIRSKVFLEKGFLQKSFLLISENA